MMRRDFYFNEIVTIWGCIIWLFIARNDDAIQIAPIKLLYGSAGTHIEDECIYRAYVMNKGAKKKESKIKES